MVSKTGNGWMNQFMYWPSGECIPIMPKPHKYTLLKCSGVIGIVANTIRISCTDKNIF